MKLHFNQAEKRKAERRESLATLAWITSIAMLGAATVWACLHMELIVLAQH